ncbi:Protein kinase-like domain protein [Fusarium austroafricanum]|uniref:Protein kinase-like domain protein n=1 Tax=Fusarium austroafricanum TaxID=2364996 RepID=A0A8H4JYW0_9HYPO|nr:Protein kinase-like domain protein [Fusarium austroafricanum]
MARRMYPDKDLEEIDDNSWIIREVIITRHASKPSGPCWDDGKGTYFSISEAPSPKPATRPRSEPCPIVGIGHGNYQIGHGIIKTHRNLGTPEHITLEALAKKSLSFKIPKVYHHGIHGNSYYIVHSTIPEGQNMVYAWPKASEATKKHWISQIADAYVELSEWTGSDITAIDGGLMREYWLCPEAFEVQKTYDPEVLRQTCETCSMDCSNIVFSHNSFEPLAFTVDEKGLVGISQWNISGFVPKDWIRTKIHCNSMSGSVPICHQLWTEGEKKDWGNMIKSALEDRGFREFWYQFALWNSKRPRID